MKTVRIAFSLVLLFTLSGTAFAQVSKFVAGTHYTQLETPVRTADNSKIEVIELFWYGCPGCYAIEPLVSAWEKSQSQDIDHKRLPAVWNTVTKIHAQAFYTAVALDAFDEVHDPFFSELHEKRNRLVSEVAIRDFFESCGISADDFDKTYNSFSVRAKVNQAEAKMLSYGPAQTPSLYVNGKYVVTLGEGGYQQMIEVVDYLVALERG